MNPVGFTGKLLDRYLASGWYRMGSRMFTCRYNFYDWGFLTTVWTRLPLQGHSFSKSVRKTVRRNERLLTYTIHRARAYADEEQVFAQYRKSKDYDLHDSAASYLLQDPNAPFDTWQVSVYLGEELVAFSYFDLGSDSVQSVCGFFDPAYQKYSLGLYTLCIEIEYAKTRGMLYHYAGYIVPGNNIFEYKRRVGPLQAYDDLNRRWVPIDDIDLGDLPDARQRTAMYEYNRLFSSIALSYSVRLRPQYFIGISQQDLQWLRREQLPFCITEHRSNRRPYWACHFYSYNRDRYLSVLCASHAYEQESMAIPPGIMRRPDPYKSYEHNGSGVAVRLLHQRSQPYTAADLERVWAAVAEANAAAGRKG